MSASRLRVYHGPEEFGDRGTAPATIPLRETVIFPGVAVPISAGRPGLHGVSRSEVTRGLSRSR